MSVRSSRSRFLSSMRVLIHLVLWVSMALLAGCHSPQQASAGKSEGRLAGTLAPPLVASLPTNAFSTFPATNALPAEWLRASQDHFVIGPGDVLEIEMLGETNSLATATVGPDGKVYYGLLRGTFIWGLTLPQAKEKLQAEAGRLLQSKPEVSVVLKGVGSRRIWVLGSVQTPGVYGIAVPTTVLEAIAFAGGPLITANSAEEQADLENSFVLRNGQRLPVNLAKLLREGDLSQNIYLESDDFIFLQPAGPREIYVLGAVTAPNAVPFTRDTSLVTAIAYSGGPLPYASLSQVAIIRGSLTQPSIATVNFHRIVKGELADIQLEPGDLVYVPFSTFRKVEMFMNYVLDTFVRTIAVNEGQNAVVKNRGGVNPTIPIGNVGPPVVAPTTQ